MKRNFFFLLLMPVSFMTNAQDIILDAPADKALIVFVRPNDIVGALENWVLMADDNELCRISNNRYVTYITSPSNVKFSSVRGGVGIGKPKEYLELELEAGKTYYVQCDIKANLVNKRVLLNRINKTTAMKLLAKAKPDNCELKKTDSEQ